jgi:hypothetical protein
LHFAQPAAPPMWKGAPDPLLHARIF